MRRLIVVLLLTLLPACSTQVAFRQDKRVHFVFPHDREKVTLPITVRWTVDPAAAGRIGSFAVMVDRPPQPPGKPLGWFARNDHSCQKVPTCPDTAYLNRHGVYTTTDTSFPLTVVKAPPSGSKGKNIHDVTVVLLDRSGRRISETAFNVSFEVPRPRY